MSKVRHFNFSLPVFFTLGSLTSHKKLVSSLTTTTSATPFSSVATSVTTASLLSLAPSFAPSSASAENEISVKSQNISRTEELV